MKMLIFYKAKFHAKCKIFASNSNNMAAETGKENWVRLGSMYVILKYKYIDVIDARQRAIFPTWIITKATTQAPICLTMGNLLILFLYHYCSILDTFTRTIASLVVVMVLLNTINYNCFMTSFFLFICCSFNVYTRKCLDECAKWIQF